MCCAMRNHFLVGVVGYKKDEPFPADLPDFVVSWEPQILLAIRYCPFCGKDVSKDGSLRIPTTIQKKES